MKFDDEIFSMCNIIFNGCIGYWGITDDLMGDLIEKFKLASFIDKYQDHLNCYGLKGAINELRDYIIELGGPQFEKL